MSFIFLSAIITVVCFKIFFNQLIIMVGKVFRGQYDNKG
jgi:hypothetical protein